LRCEGIAAQASNESHRITKPGHGHGLICTLTARMDLEVRSGDRLAHRWNSSGERYKVNIDTANDYDWLFPGTGVLLNMRLK